MTITYLIIRKNDDHNIFNKKNDDNLIVRKTMTITYLIIRP